MNGERKTAREYLRVSLDQSGNLESPAEQHADNAKAAARLGWELSEPYAEQDAVSASRYAKKRRDAFTAMLADIDGGRFGAEVLILWESSRGSRRVGEWVRLIEACEDHGILIHITSDGRTYDPANERDRRSLLEDAVDGEFESAKTSKRRRRNSAARAEQGRPGGGRAPYGYRHVYDPVTGKFAGRVEEPAEAAVIRDLFARLDRGESLRSAAAGLAERGIMTRGTRARPPRPFTKEVLRTLALNAAYAGLRVHNPVGPERVQRRYRLDGAVKAAWPALVGEEQFYRVHAMLTDPSRRTSRPGRAVHELSLIARCGKCGGPLACRLRRGREYECRDHGCYRVNADDLDQLAAAVVLAYLARPENYAQLTAPAATGPELATARAELERARGDLGDWRRRAARREVTAASFAAIEPGIVAAIAQLENRERELSTPPALGWLLSPGGDMRQRWEDAPVSARRDVHKLLLSPQYLGTLTLGPGEKGRRVAVRERVTWDRG